jgi:hypothetical protein
MRLKQPLHLDERFRVLAVVAGSYLAASAPLLVFGWQGRWWATLLFAASWPLALFAGAISFVFSSMIIRRPLTWAAGAVLAVVVLSLAVLYLATRSWIGWASVAIAAPAGLTFLCNRTAVAAPSLRTQVILKLATGRLLLGPQPERRSALRSQADDQTPARRTP